ncbi:SUMO-1 activating enzyme E1 N subunit [Anaeromyces robustus]|uniref:Ubiquitin-like 1-activating enzyme E1A n=1 Tax=Anaeromyces robustus TaxID=1754192 RepID=A0A1Y1XN97_9FUNG|nr:SUMO-1 activating enzyme E1 N subunit [Anaeromyces robustus]|eukprot:ORX86814.1 SUMO-1 activating enzyme E1 N subunit [Anaeromyces robustus]
MKRNISEVDNTSNKKVKTIHQLNDEEAALYDRQIRLWGFDAQRRLRNSSILIVGGKALSNEVCKNLVLAGVGSLTIIDDENVTVEDLGSQFLVSKKNVGQNRAKSMKERLVKLNSSVKINIISDSIENKDTSFYNEFDVVCVTGKPLESLIKINNICRKNNVKFYSADVHGIFGYIFCDLINHKYIEEKNIKYGDDTKTKQYEKSEQYSSLEDSLKYKFPSDMKLKRFLRKYSSIYFLIYTLLQFQKNNKRLPKYISEDEENTEDLNKLKEIRDHLFKKYDINNAVLNDESLSKIIRNAGMEILPICSVVGGILAQDILKVISQKELPISNWFCYDGFTGDGVINKLI